MRRVFSIIVTLCFATLAVTSAYAQSKTNGRYASIIVDADSLDIVHARQVDELRYPASLTKVMTLYLTFDAINSGQLRLDEKIKVSRYAAKVEPVKLGMRAGQTITIDNLIRAVAVRSANDAAIVLAERLAGSEEAFAQQMTAKARSLGMSRTVFKTANGLPHPEQLTTARDMAKLANAVLANHGRHYHYFGLQSFNYKGRTYTNTNKLLGQRSDVDGFKTGFTYDSGYNLIVSAQRDGRRLIAVVLGGASGASRNSHMSDLIDRGFDVLGVPASIITLAQKDSSKEQSNPIEPKIRQIIRLRPKQTIETIDVKTKPSSLAGNHWSVQIGQFETEIAAKTYSDSLFILPEFKTAKPQIRAKGELLTIRMTNLTAQSAQAACKSLEKSRHECLIIGPGS